MWNIGMRKGSAHFLCDRHSRFRAGAALRSTTTLDGGSTHVVILKWASTENQLARRRRETLRREEVGPRIFFQSVLIDCKEDKEHFIVIGLSYALSFAIPLHNVWKSSSDSLWFCERATMAGGWSLWTWFLSRCAWHFFPGSEFHYDDAAWCTIGFVWEKHISWARRGPISSWDSRVCKVTEGERMGLLLWEREQQVFS